MQIDIYVILIAGLVYVPVAVVYAVGVDEAVNGTIQGIEGDSITLTCDLRDTDPDFIWFRNQNYFLTIGESVDASVPYDFANRITVSCSDFLEACYMEIDPLTRTDSGEYGCGYQEGNNRISFSYGYLIVVNPTPPTDFSPECILYDKDRLQISSNMTKIGDEIELSCVTTGGDPNPSIYIARDGVAITQEVMGSTVEDYTLSQQDKGSTFICVMTHPALSQPRTCSFLTVDRTETDKPTALSTSKFVVEVHSLKPTATYEKSTISKPLTTPSVTSESIQPLNTPSVALIIVAVVIFLLFIICSIIFVLKWRKKTRQDPHRSQSKNNAPTPQSDVYLELNTDREKHEYEKLKTKSEDASSNIANNHDNDDYAYATPSEDYEVAAVSDCYESVERGQENSKQPYDVSYANLQRPVKAQNFNVPKRSDKQMLL